MNIFGKSKKAEIPNSVVVSESGVKFEKLTDPPGYDSKCLNDSKDYHLVVKKGNAYSALLLPDKTEYYSPQVYGSVVLTMAAHAKLFERRESLLQKLSPLFLLIGMVIVFICLITVGE